LGSLILFPRNAGRRSDTQWHETAESPTRKTSEASLVTWLDAKRLREGEDDGDGGGGHAA